MSASEALVETLVAHDIKKVFGIVGSAFIDPLDLFPAAGIEFIDVQHEQNAVHMADSYARLTGKTAIAIGQNGPGISNMVTGIATSYLTHAPVCVISPQSGSDSIGKLGFQELQQLPMFSNITKYQVHVENSSRIAELTSRALNRAMQANGPTQLNYSRNLLYDVHDYQIPEPEKLHPIIPHDDTIADVANMLLSAEKPVLLCGYGVKDSEPIQKLAKLLDVPVATTYLHNDVYPIDDKYAMGSLGYFGSKAAMKCVQDSDLVVAIGTRLNPFGTTPQYNMAYWDANKPLIQIEANQHMIGNSCNPTIGVHGDGSETMRKVYDYVVNNKHMLEARPAQTSPIPYAKYREEWVKERFDDSLKVDVETGRLPPKMVLRTFGKVLQELDGPIVTTDIGHCCSQSLAYLDFKQPNSLFTAGTFGSCGTSIPMAVGARFADAERPIFALVGDGAVNMQGINELLTCKRNNLGVTIICFRNEVWGAELLNQLIWTDARAVGTEIDNPSISNIANAFGAVGITVDGSEENFENALQESIKRQKNGQTTLIEVMCTPNMGAPFRSDAMRCPERHLDKYKHLSTDYADYERQYTYDGRKNL
eukprot:g6406.t1